MVKKVGHSDPLVDAFQDVSRSIVALTASALVGQIKAKGKPVTLAEYRVLVVLSVRGDSTPSAVAEEMGLTRPAITRILNGLDGTGLIRRRRDSKDRRVAWLSLSTKGSAVVAAVHRERARKLAPAISSLSAGERKAMVSALERLAAGLGVQRVPSRTTAL